MANQTLLSATRSSASRSSNFCFSPAETSTMLSAFTQNHTGITKDQIFTPKHRDTAQGHRRISAKARFSISLWRGNPFLFSSTFLGGQKVRAGQQLPSLREETAIQKPFHQPILNSVQGLPPGPLWALRPGIPDPAPTQVTGPAPGGHTSNSPSQERFCSGT